MAKLHMLKTLTDTINTSFILEDGDTLLVLDGGFPSETPYMYEYLKKLGGHVAAWFITHFHDDHMGCLLTILEEHPDITVDKLYCHFPSDEFICRHEPTMSRIDTSEWLTRWKAATASLEKVTVQMGEEYAFGDTLVRVLLTPDESITANPINNSSCVYRFEAAGKSILFLGDLGVEGGNRLTERTPASLLHADYLQMAHHGQHGVSKECYEAIRPTYCLWPTPSWVWDTLGEGGYDTGGFQTVIVRGWISGLRCVKKHYRMTEGDHIIDL